MEAAIQQSFGTEPKSPFSDNSRYAMSEKLLLAFVGHGGFA
jgi:hypothetical protein